MSITRVTNLYRVNGVPYAKITETTYKNIFTKDTVKTRIFEPLGDHLLKKDNLYFYYEKDLKTGVSRLEAYQGKPSDGRFLARGVDKIRKIVKSIKNGVRVNRESTHWYRTVFGE